MASISISNELEPVAPADPPPMRADARRNLANVLDAAGELFAEEGMGASMEAIAKRAGVGVGTIYRRFPTKEALVEAVVIHHFESVCDECDALAGRGSAGEAFSAVLSYVIETASRHLDLKAALSSSGVEIKVVGEPAFERMRTTLAELLERAQAAGSIRPDVNVDDVIGLVSASCAASTSFHGTSPTRLISLITDGLKVIPPQ